MFPVNYRNERENYFFEPVNSGYYRSGRDNNPENRGHYGSGRDGSPDRSGSKECYNSLIAVSPSCVTNTRLFRFCLQFALFHLRSPIDSIPQKSRSFTYLDSNVNEQLLKKGDGGRSEALENPGYNPLTSPGFPFPRDF